MDLGTTWPFLLVVGLLVVGLIAMMVFSRRRAKKQEQDTADLINAVGPGNKVKTIGGICGVVVEVDNEENTFVLETGTEQSGKCCIKFDKQAIYQTDAVVEKPDKKAGKNKDGEQPAEVTEAEAAEAAEAQPEATEGETETPVETTETAETETPEAKEEK